MSSAMANQFVEAAKEMTDQIIKLGPNPFRNLKNHHKGA
jgi:coenzyme F420-reducing hydrogenase delta subunit